MMLQTIIYILFILGIIYLLFSVKYNYFLTTSIIFFSKPNKLLHTTIYSPRRAYKQRIMIKSRSTLGVRKSTKL